MRAFKLKFTVLLGQLYSSINLDIGAPLAYRAVVRNAAFGFFIEHGHVELVFIFVFAVPFPSVLCIILIIYEAREP